AEQMASIITAVAVLEIHMERNPVATMNPRIIFLGAVPKRVMTYRAIRRCRFQRSMAMANKNPPRYKKMILFPKAAPVLARSRPPVSGNSTKGNREVTGIGMASEIHQMAIQAVEANTAKASWDMP